MKTIETIKAKLDQYPEMRYRASQNKIDVLPTDESGFTVSLRVNSVGYSVFFDGWHEEFETEDEALDCFAFGLSSECRLKVVLHGSMPTKWTVEGLDNGEWLPDWETGLFIKPFWRSKRVVYRQNKWIVGLKKPLS